MVVLATTVVVAGCAAPTATKELTIGLCGPLSGPAAFWGLGDKWGMEYFVEDVNAAGGLKAGKDVYTLKCVYHDDKYDAAEGMTAVTKMVHQDKINMLLASVSSPAIMAYKPMCEQEKVLVIIRACAGGAIRTPPTDYTFRITPAIETFKGGLYTWISKNRPELKRFVLWQGQSPSGEVDQKYGASIAPGLGIEIVWKELIPGTVKDFLPMITKAKSLNADVIDASTILGGRFALLIKQAHESGFEGIIIHDTFPNPKDVVEISGIEAAEGSLGCVMGLVKKDTPYSTEKFKDLYDRCVRDHDFYHEMVGDCYGAMMCWKKAVEEVGTVDTTAVKDYLAKPGLKLKFKEDESVYPEIRFGGTETFGFHRQSIQPLYIIEVRNGDEEVLDMFLMDIP